MYESMIKWRGRPILPPVMTLEKRTEARQLRTEAVRREQLRAKQSSKVAGAAKVDDDGDPHESSITSSLLGGENTENSRRLTRWYSEEEPTNIARPTTSQSSSLSVTGSSWTKDGLTNQGISQRIPRSSSAQANLHQTRPSTHVRSRLLNYRANDSALMKSSATGLGKDGSVTYCASWTRPEGPPIAARRSRALRRTVHSSRRTVETQSIHEEANKQKSTIYRNSKQSFVPDRTMDDCELTENTNDSLRLDDPTGSIAEPIPGSPGRLERGGTFIVVPSSSTSGATEAILPTSATGAEIDDMAEQMHVEVSVKTPGTQESDSASYESATEEDFSLTQSPNVSWPRDDNKPEESSSTSSTLTTTSSSVKKELLRPNTEESAPKTTAAAPAVSVRSNLLVRAATVDTSKMLTHQEGNECSSKQTTLGKADEICSGDTALSSSEGAPRVYKTLGYEASGSARRPSSLKMPGCLFDKVYPPASSDVITLEYLNETAAQSSVTIATCNDHDDGLTISDCRSSGDTSATESSNIHLAAASPVPRRTDEEEGSDDKIETGYPALLCSEANKGQIETQQVDATTDARSSLDSGDETGKDVSAIGIGNDEVKDAYSELCARDKEQEGCESHKCLGRRHTYLILQAKQKTPTNLVTTPEESNLQELASRLSNCAQLVTSLTPRSSPVINKSLASLHESFRRATSLTAASHLLEPTATSSSDQNSQQSCTLFEQAEDLNANRPLHGNSRRDCVVTNEDKQKRTRNNGQHHLITNNPLEEIQNSPVVSSSSTTEMSSSNILPTPLPRSTFTISTEDICWGDRNGNRNLIELQKVDLHSATARGFEKFTALCKGHLCRKLLASSRVQKLIRDIVDMVRMAISLHQPLPECGVARRKELRKATKDNNSTIESEEEATADMPHSEEDMLFHERILLGLEGSCRELHRLFFDTSPAERVALMRNGEALEKSLETVMHFTRTPVRPKKLSSATLKRRLRKLLEQQHITVGPSKSGFRRSCCATSSSHRVY